MAKLECAAITIALLACCVSACAADAVLYDGVFEQNKGAIGRRGISKLREWLWKHWQQREARYSEVGDHGGRWRHL